jgi:cytoplasmic iron level regulating protein YaaA (DUF328/UPF0246 family)
MTRLDQKLFILIPPSEGKASGGTYPPLSQLNEHAQQAYGRLMNFKGDVGALYGLKDKALKQALMVNQTLLSSPTLPAIERYSGVVYEGIDYPSLSKEAKNFFNDHVRIISAMFGLLAPLDLIPDYKLKIEKLDLAKFWRSIIAKQLEGYFIIDLLPQAHQKAVAYTQGLGIEFVMSKKGKVMPAGHHGKLIKGKFVRWVCQNQYVEAKDLKRFSEDGFCYDSSLSNATHLVFKLSH